jgi:hypothetical protein
MSGTSKVVEMLAQEKHRHALERLHRAIAMHDAAAEPDRGESIRTVLLARAQEKGAREQWLRLMMESLHESQHAPVPSFRHG